jgi:hypothetical protein
MQCIAFLTKIVHKLLDKSPLNYKLTKAMTAFDPRRMAASDKRDSNKTLLKTVLQVLIDCNRFAESEAEDVIQQYCKFVDEYVDQHRSAFMSFSPGERIDVLFHDAMAGSKHFKKLWAVVEQVLLISHGQATVERGFSINKQVETDNLIGSTFEAKHLVCDHTAAVGGICIIDVDNKQLLMLCANARKRYSVYLENQKKNAADAAVMQKRKALDDETAELKKKKQKLETDMEALLASADDFAEKAEKNHQLTLIAKSNAMRKAAKEKAAEIKEVEQQLNTKLLELSNC